MNLLYIFTDEQRFDTLRAYGNTLIETPHLDRLASESIVFDRAYVTQAVCTPSRSTLLTGLYPHSTGCVRNNIPLRDETRTLAEMVDGTTYRTGYFGKWHLGDEVFRQHGFDEWITTEDGYNGHFSPGRDRHAHSTYFDWLEPQQVGEVSVSPEGYRGFRRDTVARLPEEFSKPTYLAGEACRFIEENAKRPFMLFVNFLEPHMPFFGPHDEQYDPDTIPLPPNFNDPPGPAQSTRDRNRVAAGAGYKSHMGTDEPSEKDWRQLIARYWGLVSEVDTAVGSILDGLERSDAADDTLVVFTSDHGDQMGSHRMVAKCTQYEESIRVPLLLRIPGHRRNGSRVKHPVSHVDLLPTLLDFLGQPIPDGLEGFTLRPLLDRDERPTEGDVFVEWTPLNPEDPHDVPIRTIITPDLWKFNWRGSKEDELYHLSVDPHETSNLAGRAEHQKRIADLTQRIQRWQNRTRDTLWCHTGHAGPDHI